jgi:hypothetical protein
LRSAIPSTFGWRAERQPATGLRSRTARRNPQAVPGRA